MFVWFCLYGHSPDHSAGHLSHKSYQLSLIGGFLFVWERIPKTSFSQYFCLTSSPVSLLQFPRPCMEINRVTPGNQPPVRADYPRFSSDCLMIALPPDKAHTSSAKIIAQHYPSKLSDLKIIPHLPPKLSLISASLVNSASTFCNTGSISLRQGEKIPETGRKLKCGRAKRFRGKAEPQ